MTLGDLGGVHVTLNTTNKWGVTRCNYHPSLVVIGLKLFIWDHCFKTLTKMSHTFTYIHTHTYTDRNSDCIVSFPEQVQARQKRRGFLTGYLRVHKFHDIQRPHLNRSIKWRWQDQTRIIRMKQDIGDWTRMTTEGMHHTTCHAPDLDCIDYGWKWNET